MLLANTACQRIRSTTKQVGNKIGNIIDIDITGAIDISTVDFTGCRTATPAPALIRKLKRRKLSNTKIIPYLSHNKLADVYQRAKVFILPNITGTLVGGENKISSENGYLKFYQ